MKIEKKGEKNQTLTFNLKKPSRGAGKEAQWSRALAALPADPGWISHTQVMAYNCQ